MAQYSLSIFEGGFRQAVNKAVEIGAVQVSSIGQRITRMSAGSIAYAEFVLHSVPDQDAARSIGIWAVSESNMEGSPNPISIHSLKPLPRNGTPRKRSGKPDILQRAL